MQMVLLGFDNIYSIDSAFAALLNGGNVVPLGFKYSDGVWNDDQTWLSIRYISRLLQS